MFTRNKRPVMKVLSLLMGAALAFTLTACGSGSGSASSTNESSNTKIRLANFGMYPSSAYLALAIENGYFEKRGLDVQLNPPLLNSADMLNTVLNGDAELALTAPNGVAFARNLSKPVTILATTISGFPLQIAFQPAIDKKLRSQGLTEDSPIADRVAALKGMTLGALPSGSSTDASLRYLLETNGMDPDKDLTLNPMSDQASMVAALRAGQIDGLVSNLGGAATAAEASGVGVLWDMMAGNETLLQYPFNVVAASESYTKSNPETIQKFLDALFEARTALQAGLSPEDAVKIKNIVALDMDQSLYDLTMEGFSPRLAEPFTTSDAAWEASLKITNITADNPVKVPASEAINNSFAEKVK